jgi:eukaryotic-like serine/threonine-protein kinase
VLPAPSNGVRIVGRYALYDEIASGGMATVHIGRLLGPIGFARTVAIKRPHAQFARDPEFVSMFLDEARLAARIHHPNVAGILDVVAVAGELLLVMEYIQGESFARLIRATRESRRPVPLPILVAIMIGILDGLHAAHEATNDRGEPLGLVHRDVSPHNLLVGTDGVARVLDFGVAKAAGRIQTTRDGQLKGKISYMAPEQIQGAVDRTTDVHAVAVVLWEALTGRRLFFAENDVKTLANALASRAEPPSVHNPLVPFALDTLVLRGLAPNQSARFSTAREMARALQGIVRPAPASDVGDWVKATAGHAIALRAARIATIERSTPTDSDLYPLQLQVHSPAPISVSTVGLRRPIANDAHEWGAILADPSGDPGLEKPLRPRRRLRTAALVMALLIGGAIWWYVMRAPRQGLPPRVAPAASEAMTAAPPPQPRPSETPLPEMASAAASVAAKRTPAKAGTTSTAATARAAPRLPSPSPTTSPRNPPDEFDHVMDSRQ